MTDAAATKPRTPNAMQSVAEVLRVAMPLMISTGTFSLVLFADRTLLLYYNGEQMSASMAAGNLYWTLVCLPIGIASMTGAIVAQYVGSGQEKQVGRFLWQSVWLSIAMTPLFAVVAVFTPWLFQVSGQVESLIPLETTYMRILLLGAVGSVLETGLSGFFSGTQRTRVLMWASIATGLLNLVLDVWFIFGGLGLPAMGISGAAWASVVAFWFKALLFGALLLGQQFDRRYGIREGFSFDRALLKKLLFFGLPAGLQYLTEAGGFTVIVLQIGQLGDVPLRATTMAINFNMIAFIPLIGVAIAASVLVGHHLTETGPRRAIVATRAALMIAWTYSLVWAVLYFAAPEFLLSLYEIAEDDPATVEAISIARHLLAFVGVYVLLDATQLILAGALRGAGDTWFVLAAALAVSIVSVALGIAGESYATTALGISQLHWWWTVITIWVWLLAVVMVGRYWQGKWQRMRMVS
ncbi:MAG: MATE family efflux transporter [Planctomycetaceae bacterium]